MDTVKVVKGKKGPALDFGPVTHPETGEHVDLCRPAGKPDFNARSMFGSSWTRYRVVPVFPTRDSISISVGDRVQAEITKIIKGEDGLPRYAFARVSRIVQTAEQVAREESEYRAMLDTGHKIIRFLNFCLGERLSQKLHEKTGKNLFTVFGATRQEIESWKNDNAGIRFSGQRYRIAAAIVSRMSEKQLAVLDQAYERLTHYNKRYYHRAVYESANIIIEGFYHEKTD